jgi:hypothetical protein
MSKCCNASESKVRPGQDLRVLTKICIMIAWECVSVVRCGEDDVEGLNEGSWSFLGCSRGALLIVRKVGRGGWEMMEGSGGFL